MRDKAMAGLVNKADGNFALGCLGTCRVWVYTHYEDGQYWLSNSAGYYEVNIPCWQWWLYRAFRWLENKVGRWVARLDNAAYILREGNE
jgi:hypothetical protein